MLTVIHKCFPSGDPFSYGFDVPPWIAESLEYHKILLRMAVIVTQPAQQALASSGRKRERARARETREDYLSPRVSPSRAPVFSCAHYFQAPATQANSYHTPPAERAFFRLLADFGVLEALCSLQGEGRNLEDALRSRFIFLLQPPLKVCVANRNIGQIYFTALFLFSFSFFFHHSSCRKDQFTVFRLKLGTQDFTDVDQGHPTRIQFKTT